MSDPRRATQAELEAAIRRHPTEYGSRPQPALRDPLTEAELAHPHGQGYGVAITDVDCTPRPRYGESQAAFLRRMAGYGADVAALQRDLRLKNRQAALRRIEQLNGDIVYWTQCACGWCGLRVLDPELARREYDVHACAAESIGDDAVSRAQAHSGKATMPARRKAAVLQPALAGAVVDESVKRTQSQDDTAERFALLELDRK